MILELIAGHEILQFQFGARVCDILDQRLCQFYKELQKFFSQIRSSQTLIWLFTDSHYSLIMQVGVWKSCWNYSTFNCWAKCLYNEYINHEVFDQLTTERYHEMNPVWKQDIFNCQKHLFQSICQHPPFQSYFGKNLSCWM